jgi:hypothetical protein
VTSAEVILCHFQTNGGFHSGLRNPAARRDCTDRRSSEPVIDQRYQRMPKERSPLKHAKLLVCRKSQPACFPPGRSVVTRSAFLIRRTALQNSWLQATWNCVPYAKFFSQPEDALTTQPNSLSRRPD